MSTNDLKPCKCGATPVIRKTNKRKFNVTCPCCQKFYTRDFDSRDGAVTAWNDNIESVGKKKRPSAR